MDRWENFAGFDVAQQNNFYCHWQRENLEAQASPSGYHYDSWYEEPHSSFSISCYSYAYTAHGSGPSLPAVYDSPETQAGSWGPPETLAFFEETTAPGEDHDEEALEDPNLCLDIEELNKEFMVESEEVYDSLMNCHWQPLDTVFSNIPEEIPK